jgi:hypothetical protein
MLVLLPSTAGTTVLSFGFMFIHRRFMNGLILIMCVNDQSEGTWIQAVLASIKVQEMTQDREDVI